ncbi:hypothetical protein [Denitrobaculum tricleocarpae]|uniref:Uncharacterized protein n=1 Tax=Denitrobaculum tricleocarpae TaxID=2591009 RepID=A0A545TUF4_9PROT|nr:hypothetical protein [Denitrobaculum tricleocarpae]TQV80848.1 hypothetical protein FKG95_11920 [Denitrobaculum tricleocarpae]
MKLLRFLKSWWNEVPDSQPGTEARAPVQSAQARPRVHRKMLPVVRYLEKIRNSTGDLNFRYVGPNQMNGDAEEIQIFILDQNHERGVTVRYLDHLELYFIDGPSAQKLHQKTAREVLASLSEILTDAFPGQELWGAPSAQDRKYQS